MSIRMWKRIAAMVVALVPFSPAGAQTLQKLVFATDWLAQAEHGGFYQALAEGIYKKHNLDVTIRMGGPQVNGLQLLAAGQIDVAMADGLQALSAIEQNVPVVAISNDDTGISEDPDVRFEVARKIVQRAADFGIPAHDIVVDPLVMPIGAMATAGLQVFALVRRLREELGVNTTCGASNISFGLPNRHGINAAFLPMAIASGLTSAITSPLHGEMLQAIKAADVLMGNDPHCAAWIARNGDGAAVSAGRRGGRAARRSAAGG